MEQFLIKYIRECAEEFIIDNPIDEVDIAILDNYTEYVVERLSILFERLRETKRESK